MGKLFLVNSNTHMTHRGLLYAVCNHQTCFVRGRGGLRKVKGLYSSAGMFSQTSVAISGLICSQNTASLIAFSPVNENDLRVPSEAGLLLKDG